MLDPSVLTHDPSIKFHFIPSIIRAIVARRTPLLAWRPSHRSFHIQGHTTRRGSSNLAILTHQTRSFSILRYIYRHMYIKYDSLSYSWLNSSN